MTVKTSTILADSLHNASSEVVSSGLPLPTRTQIAERRLRVQYGKGCVVGCVAAMMAMGMHFDDAWRKCLAIEPHIHPLCIPEGWPSSADYVAAGEGT